MTRPPLPYSPDVEQPSAGEQKTIDGIIQGMPAQDAYGPARQRYFDEVMTFRPAHSLAAHRPLGSVMRARLQIYKALSEFRHHENGIPEQDPATIDAIPA